MTTNSKLSLLAKKRASLFFKKAEESGHDEAPWSLGNIRTYQRFACSELKARSAILKKYLESRKARPRP